jgi:hypothetical protein
VSPVVAADSELVYPAPTWKERVFDPQWFSTSNEVAMAVCAIIGIVCSLLIGCIVIIKRNDHVFISASVLFSMLILFGSVMCYLSIFLWMPYSTDSTCQALPWLLTLGFVVMFTSLLAKNWRILKIYRKSEVGVVTVISNIELFAIVASMLGLQGVVLLVWNVADPMKSEVLINDPYRPSKNELQCNGDHVKVYATILLVINGLQLVVGLVIAFCIRKVKYTLFNESQFIFLSVYNLSFFVIIIVALQVSGTISPNDLFLIRSILILIGVFSTVGLIFFPKIYYSWIKLDKYDQGEGPQVQLKKGNSQKYQSSQNSSSQQSTNSSSVQDEHLRQENKELKREVEELRAALTTYQHGQ